jgi:hypothetical protein
MLVLKPSRPMMFIESVRTSRIRPYPAGRFIWGGAVPGTSCQATIAPTLRDISQLALASACRRCYNAFESDS